MIRESKNFFLLLVAASVLIAAAAGGAAYAQRIYIYRESPPPQQKEKEREQKAKESPFSQLSPVGSVAIILQHLDLGMGWDSGVLKLGGNKYNFQIRGIKVATAGVSKATTRGVVFNLIKYRDFSGKYLPAGPGLEVFKGKERKIDQDVQLPVSREKESQAFEQESQAFKNDQGVYIFLQTAEPVNLKIGPGGFTIRLKEAL
jgi:hypothetical protein